MTHESFSVKCEPFCFMVLHCHYLGFKIKQISAFLHTSEMYFCSVEVILHFCYGISEVAPVLYGVLQSILEQSSWSQNNSLLGTYCQLGICSSCEFHSYDHLFILLKNSGIYLLN